MPKQTCPKCGSHNVRPAQTIPLGDPVKAAGMLGWECEDCGHAGKDFFINELLDLQENDKVKINEKEYEVVRVHGEYNLDTGSEEFLGKSHILSDGKSDYYLYIPLKGKIVFKKIKMSIGRPWDFDTIEEIEIRQIEKNK